MSVINLNLWQTWAYNASSGAVTEPSNGSFVQALAEYLGLTEPSNDSWIQAIAEYYGITAPVNDSWIQALAIDAGATEPVNGSWLWALAINAAPPVVPFVWDTNTTLWESESRTWDLS